VLLREQRLQEILRPLRAGQFQQGPAVTGFHRKLEFEEGATLVLQLNQGAQPFDLILGAGKLKPESALEFSNINHVGLNSFQNFRATKL
jgi:hypothetical protein